MWDETDRTGPIKKIWPTKVRTPPIPPPHTHTHCCQSKDRLNKGVSFDQSSMSTFKQQKLRISREFEAKSKGF